MKIFIFTLGCPKNQVDSEKLAGTLVCAGYELVDKPENADLIILNTCAFISEAEHEAEEYIAKLSGIAPLLVIGCLPSRKAAQERMRDSWMIGDPPDEAENISMIARIIFWDPDQGSRLLDSYPYSYLKIAEGCSRRCSFCVIPWIRGRLRSREVKAILEEARGIIELGKKEIILVAQETTQFGWDTGECLEDLLVAIDKLEGDFWLRLMYVHPDGMTRSLAAALASLDHLAPYIHMPVQHLSGNVLKGMVRAGGQRAVERALALVEKYLPDAFIRTELMVGFPGETEEDFRGLLNGIESGLFQRVAVFPFYNERGSRAWNMRQQDKRVVAGRYREAMEAAHDLHMRVQKGLVGKHMRLLVDEPGLARTGFDAPEVDFSVRVSEKLVPGDFHDARITGMYSGGDLVA